MSDSFPTVEIEQSHGAAVVHLRGEWTLAHYKQLSQMQKGWVAPVEGNWQINEQQISKLDTAGADILCQMLGQRGMGQLLQSPTLPANRKALLEVVYNAVCSETDIPRRPKTNGFADILARVGQAMAQVGKAIVDLLAFTGLVVQTLFLHILKPRTWRLNAFSAQMEEAGLNAAPIIILMNFMIGAVVAFLGATVLNNFGASIFTVHLVGYSFLREFGPMLSAIMVAGRTASAFAAQIGSMRANEEVDAIRVIGLSPIETLVLPRVTALMVALPMLTFIAIIAGLLGGLMVCAFTLNISSLQYVSIVHESIGVRHFFVGMVKTPIFAFMIALIGCLEGFKVSGSAQSVGEHTTSAVVQSIFMVIVIDAIAALICMKMDW